MGSKALKMLFLTMLLFAAPSLQAQKRPAKGVWSGDFSISMGTNFEREESSDVKFSNVCEEGKARIGWRTDKFRINGNVDLGFSSISQSQTGVTFKVQEADSSFILQSNIAMKESRNTNVKSWIDGMWSPDGNNDISFSATTQSRLKNFGNASISFDLLGYLIDGEDGVQMSTVGEEGDNKVSTWSATGDWTHRFDTPGRQLETWLEMSASIDNRSSEWERGTVAGDLGEYSVSRTWRITPQYRSDSFRAGAQYSDKNFAGVDNLDVDFSLDARYCENMDVFSAATLIHEVWVDSTSYREDFHYRSLTASPTARVRWSRGIVSLDASLTPQLFTDRLTNSSYDEPFNPVSVTLLGKVSGRFDFSGGHGLRLSLNRDITRPTYLNLCWFSRQGNYSDVFIQGNPSLLPAKSDKATLDYLYTRGRFSTEFQIGYKYETDRIEYTFNEEITEDAVHRVYTWINAGWSGTSNSRLTLKWNGSALKAELSGNYNYFYGVIKSGSVSKSSDYSINGYASYTLKGGWVFLGRGRYQSKIIRSYNSMTQYVGCDVRVDKKFGKQRNFGLFVEGRDLFDQKIDTVTYSEDFKYFRIDTDDFNRRLFLFGATFSF